MGALERRLAKLEAQLASLGLWDTKGFEKQVAKEALTMLSVPELKLVVSGLERGKQLWEGLPADTPMAAEAWEAILTEEELHALEHLEELKAELREAG